MSARVSHIIPLSFFTVVALIVGLMRATTRPLTQREWTPQQKVAATVQFAGEQVVLNNIRNTDFTAGESATPVYYDRTLRLGELRRAWLIVEKSGTYGAQLMVDFEFAGGERIVISPEPRLEAGETFSAFRGLFRRYELFYVVASEFDRIRQGALVNGHDVYLLELTAPIEKLQSLLVSMGGRATELTRSPEFYHPLFNSTSGNVLRHLRKIAPKKVNRPLFFPANAPIRIQDMGLLREDVSSEHLKGRGHVSHIARRWRPGDDFSAAIHRATDGLADPL
jgi:hypothetical protein